MKSILPKLPKIPNLLNSKILTSVIFFLIALVGFLAGTQYQRLTTPPTPSQPPLPSQATVSRVIDGDTLELSTGQTVRLYGITCPEQGNPFYQEATNFTQNFTANQNIHLEYEEGYESDKFGRLLAYVIIPNPPNSPNPLNLNIELAKQGLAEVQIYEKRRKLIYQDELLEAQAQAKENKLGIWSD